MDWSGMCAAVVPCWNEGETISALVEAIRPFLPTVLVVDDGSADPTGARAAQAGARVCRHAGNQGKGAALQTGMSEARRLGFAWAIMMDGDGQHRPQDIPAFLNCAERTGAMMVVGDRTTDAAAMPWIRRFVNRWMSRQISRRLGQWVPDSQCGFRLLNLEIWAGLELRTRHFEIESELLLAFSAAGHRIEFVPIPVVGTRTRSRIRPLVDTWRWWRWWQRIRFERTTKEE